MGRKPNQAIRHFFERGPKLNDNSNRYQQTCRRCGEKFEKGRQEALVAHIAKTCQGVSVQERERFVAEVQYGKPSAKAKKATVPAEAPPALPELSGLEALAEVSRHHGQQSLQSDLIAHNPEFMTHASTTTSNPLPIHTATTSSSMLGSTTATRGLELPDASLRLAALRALVPPRPSFLSLPLDSDDALVDYGHGEAPTIGMNYSRHAPEPVMDTNHDSPGPADDLVDYSHGQALVIDEDYTRHHQTLPVRETPTIPPPRSVPPPPDQTQAVDTDQDRDQMRLVAGYVADQSALSSAEMMNPISSVPVTSGIEAPNFHFTSGLDTQDTQFQMWSPSGPSTAAPKKVRGAFAPDRRTAVKEVRRKGACLRCRMLKKSCDSADPCKECAKLENARMWKGQCVRTRLLHIFNVFSSTLFMNIAHKTIEQLRGMTSFANLPGRLEVSYFPSAGLSVTFPCLRIATASENSRSRTIINTENEGVGVGSTFDSKISQYGSRLLSMHFDAQNERSLLFTNMSKFMHHTLKVAVTMTSCVLIARAIDLWICVLLLTKADNELLAIHEPRLPPINAPVDLGHNALQNGEGVHYIYVQLRRKLERACDVHFRAIMTELEKSLIQRKQADNFETFIGTVILLRCLEMVGYMYKGFDHLVDATVSTTRRDVPYGAESWPLEKAPSHYWQQGERFSDLLASMLKLRKVLPVLRVQDGAISADSPDKTVRDWFEAMDLHEDVLQFARDRPYDNVDGNTWELRWMGKLFET